MPSQAAKRLWKNSQKAHTHQLFTLGCRFELDVNGQFGLAVTIVERHRGVLGCGRQV
jgi:hypothetical protein